MSSSPLERFAFPALALAAILLAGASQSRDVIASILLHQQDLWLFGLSAALAGLALLPIKPMSRPVVAGWRPVAMIAAAAALICYLGHYWLLLGYDFTRDEQMATFDTAIFSAGHLVWPLPPEWQAHTAELNLRFMLEAPQQLAWVSAYLPMNALLRAAFGTMADPALAGPVYTGLSALLLWSCARRIWPDKPETAIICVLLLVSAGQVMITGMTAYAMPAHLFFNLLWLRLFLTDRPITHLGSVTVGFVATGLHQPLFHPLFVAPFMLLLLTDRNWRRLAIFVPAYTLIGAFWLYWPLFIQTLIAAPQAAGVAPDVDYLARLLGALAANRDNLSTMAANMLRFCTWQNVLLLPLLLASWRFVRKDRLAAALAASFVLPALMMTIILPSQGHGFGYRYFHAVLGNAVLLAGYGWNALSHDRDAPAIGALRSSVLHAVALSLVVLMPVQAWLAHRLYEPFAVASARIDASGADYAIIPEGNLILFHDLVLNRPDLSNRPIRLLEPMIADPEDLARRICRPGVHVALVEESFFDPLIRALQLPAARLGPRLENEEMLLAKSGCTVIKLRRMPARTPAEDSVSHEHNVSLTVN